MAQRLELAAAGHLVGQLFEGDFGAWCVEFLVAELQNGEVVADQEGVVGVVGD